ncbi:MAG: CusA/CzcA family heavy metal efflux RND transporter [Candidatus Obscuribacterales bacterium]|nr:CusA/CzcA family heavy metal efflux RND transporter [Candidatus Obscuribacterales bacterium]
MINALIQFSVKQRLLVVLLTVLLIAAGVYCLTRLPIDAVPDVTNVQVQVLTAAPALAPLEVERLITFPIEVSMGGLPGIEEIRSISKFGLSAVTIIFKDNVDIYFARQLVLERLTQVQKDIPSELGTPEMGPISTGLGEIYQYQLKARPGAEVGAMQLRTIQDWIVRLQLIGVPGITEVNSFGGLKKQYQIRLDPMKLQSYELSLHDVMQAVAANNQNVGGAYIERIGEQYVLRGIGLVKTLDDIGRIVVMTGKEGIPIYVRDLGKVVLGAEVRQGAVTADGKGETIIGIAMMLRGENSRVVAEKTHERIEEIKKSLPSGVELETFYNRSDLVERAIKTVESNLAEGAILVILVLLVLLGSWRGSLLVAAVIPLSMLFAAILMTVFGISGNLMSLGAIDFGLIVDGAVVMVENAFRQISDHENSNHQKKPPLQNQVLDACLEVGRPVVFAVAIIIIVYLPILALTGVEGKMFKPMAATVVFALAGSLLLSLTFIPATLTLIMKEGTSDKESFLIGLAKRLYRPSLAWALKNKTIAVSIASVLFLTSAIIFPTLGAEFVPRLDEGALAAQIQQLPSVSLTQSIETATAAEKVLLSFPEVTKVVTKIGRAEIATDPMSVDFGDLYVGLRPKSEWSSARSKEELVEKMSAQLKERVPYAVFSFSQPIELRTAELISGVRSDIAIKVFGEDLEKLKTTGEEISRVVQKISGATDVKVEQVAGLPQLLITPDREKIARLGMNVEDVNTLVESLIAGKQVGLVYKGDQRFALIVRMIEEGSKDLETIKNLLVPVPNGMRIPLKQIASVKIIEGPNQISREDRHRRIVVELNVRNRDIGSFVEEAQKAIDREVNLPSGYYVTWGGQFENLQNAQERLLIVVPVALFLIFVLLFSSFGSIKQSLLIFTGVPFAIVGGIYALLIRGMPFSISAAVGFIALSGVAVLNGVVMVSYINTLRERGEPLQQAVSDGALVRLRPVLMTALVASLGFVPMAISSSAGAEVQRPLATVVIGGLISSTILTLYLLPILYLWFERSSDSQISDPPP